MKMVGKKVQFNKPELQGELTVPGTSPSHTAQSCSVQSRKEKRR